jgi:pyruvate dehydrogenase E2 component (dihydrolipoamide acetyltransferase)
MDVKLPNLGEAADSGVVVNVFVKEGDTIAKDQALLELENEKAVASIPSPVAGAVARVYVQPGDKVVVGQRLVAVTEPGRPEAPPAAPPVPSVAATPATGEELPPPSSTAAQPLDAEPPAAAYPPVAAPSIRALAAQLGIDLSQVHGSQRGGRIVMADLRAHIQRLQRLATTTPTTPGKPLKAAPEPVDFSRWGPVTVKPLTSLRQVISRRMSESWTSVPRVTQFDEADVTDLMALRARYAPAYAERGTRLTLSGFVLKAVVDVLRQWPLFNASLDALGSNLVFKAYYHIGLAVDTDAGLLVPVIRDADKKSLLELSRELETLAAKARERKLMPDEMKGGSFTISNQGGIGGGHFTPVINLPEVAILGVGRGALKPVWRSDQVEPRTLLPLALSYDHRVIDGGQAARFVVDLVRALERFDEAAVQL